MYYTYPTRRDVIDERLDTLATIGAPFKPYPGIGYVHIDEVPGVRYKLGDDINTLSKC